MPQTIHEDVTNGRVSGILMPLAAMKTEGDWGVGDFHSLTEWTAFFASLGTKIVQILPLQETEPGQTCPYSALSAFATDPVYADIAGVQDVQECQQAQEYIASISPDIARWHNAPGAPFAEVKKAKLHALWLGYKHFLQVHAAPRTARAKAFEAYRSFNAAWLNNYATFRALKDFYQWQTWTQWPEPLRDCTAAAVEQFNAQYREYVEFYAYVQWILDQQLRQAKAAAQNQGILIFGDIPFGTNLDSAEVWAERQNFRPGWEVGAPADQFSQGGQRWGLPAYDWPHIQHDNFGLWRRKIARATELYDLFRLDHLVGFFRTYVFAPGEENGAFDVQEEQAQIDRGYAFLRMVLDVADGKMPVGEDLGVIPNYVRRMLADLKIPGYKVLRWEREDNGYNREPRQYPVVSLATTSTHDTETLRGWWEMMPAYERANMWEMISAQKTDGNIPFTPDTQRAILRRVLDSASALVMFSWQDIIGTLDRVNTPGVVDDKNWTYRSAYTPQQAAEHYAVELENYKNLLKETGRA